MSTFSLLLAGGCLPPPPSTSDDTGSVDSGGGPTGATLSVTLEGDDHCGTCALLPEGATYATPRDMTLGMIGVRLLDGAADSDPVALLTSSSPVAAELAGSTVIASLDTGSVADGRYSHLALDIAWLILETDARGHAEGFSVPGSFSMDLCLTDGENQAGDSCDQGDYAATFDVGGLTSEASYELEVQAYPQETPCASVATGGGEYRVTLALPVPVVVSRSDPVDIEIAVVATWADSFGWVDGDGQGFETGVFDVGVPPNTELPVFASLRGFAARVAGAACGED